MAKKRIVKIPNSATIKCPHCGKKTRLTLFPDSSIYFHDCKKCKQKIETPPAHCCLICAFSNKQCPQSLITEAKMKNLEIRYPISQDKQCRAVSSAFQQNYKQIS